MKNGMIEKIEGAFKDLISALQVARLYPDWHPQFKKSVDKAFEGLSTILEEREELIIGIIGEELAFEKEIFFLPSLFIINRSISLFSVCVFLA